MGQASYGPDRQEEKRKKGKEGADKKGKEKTASRLAEERVPVSEQGLPVEVGLAASPAPVAAAEIAAVVTAAARGREGETDEVDATTAVASAGTAAADEGAGTRGRGQAADERQRRGKSVASPAAAPPARGKKGKWPRAQPAARRPGAGLGPGSPGPLLGWLLPGRSPQELTRPSSSQGGPSQQIASDEVLPAGEQIPADRGAVQEPGMTPPMEPGSGNRAPPAATEVAAAAGEIVPPQMGTRRSARLGAITWGPPRGGRTPWMPAGRGGLNGAATGTAGGAGRGARGGFRGGLRGGRGGRNRIPRSDIPVRTGPWRERHDRPEMQEAGANEEREGSDNSRNDPEFMGGEEEESEEISLDDEEEPARRATQRQERAAGGDAPQSLGGEGEPATEDTDVPSPADLAGKEDIWRAAGAWNVDILSRGDQPFLVRRLPPQILDRYFWSSGARRSGVYYPHRPFPTSRG
ncbi:unnamed protein product [Closterium sp. Naga37s-1]|nr:unnamed protein product [Closterium sp. Naga37s-1]